MSGKYARDDNTAWSKPDWTLKKPTKSTATGAAVKAGQNLASDITNAAATADAKGIGWEKPSWAQGGGGGGGNIGGQNLASDITNAASQADAKGIGWEKPSWAQGGGGGGRKHRRPKFSQ